MYAPAGIAVAEELGLTSVAARGAAVGTAEVLGNAASYPLSRFESYAARTQKRGYTNGPGSGNFTTPPRKKPRQPFISPDTKRPPEDPLPPEMPKRKNVYQGSTSRAQYSKTLKHNTLVTKYQKKLIKKNTKRGGTSRLYDMVAPPLVVYNRNFFPRRLIQYPNLKWGSEESNGFTLATQGHVYTCEQFPMLTTREAAQYILKSQEVPHALAWEDNSDVWKNFPSAEAHNKAGVVNVDSAMPDMVDHTLTPETPPGMSTAFIASKLPISEGLYGYMEEIKYTYKITNPNETPITVELLECRPRDAISAFDSLSRWNPDGSVNSLITQDELGSRINPMLCMKQDFIEREDVSQFMKLPSGEQVYPRMVEKNTDSNEWPNAKLGKNFHRYYKVLCSKHKTLQPGEIFMYDVVIPGFGFKFDRYLEKSEVKLVESNSTTDVDGFNYRLKEAQSTFTRFLVLKTRGVKQYQNDESLQSSAGWGVSHKVYPTGLKCTLLSRKYLKARLVPRTYTNMKMRTEGAKDIDAFGKMSTVSVPTMIEAATNLVRFNGPNIQAVNKYPNVADVIVKNDTSNPVPVVDSSSSG